MGVEFIRYYGQRHRWLYDFKCTCQDGLDHTLTVGPYDLDTDAPGYPSIDITNDAGAQCIDDCGSYPDPEE